MTPFLPRRLVKASLHSLNVRSSGGSRSFTGECRRNGRVGEKEAKMEDEGIPSLAHPFIGPYLHFCPA